MLNRLARMFGVGPAAAAPPAPRVRLGVEPLEDRAVPATWTAATVAKLVRHINDANASPGPDTIILSAGRTFTLTAVDNSTDGPTGLPVITDPGVLTIVGNGDTIERKGT